MEMWKSARRHDGSQEYPRQSRRIPDRAVRDTLHTFYETTWVGMTEKEAKEKVGQVLVVRMPIEGYKNWLPLPLCEGTMEFAHQWSDLSGYQKIIYDAKTRKFLGDQHLGYGGKDAFQYLLYLLKKGDHRRYSQPYRAFHQPYAFIQLSRLRSGMKNLVDLG